MKGRYINLNASRMKNIIVLKDLPSNIVDEAIVILKAGSKVKSIKEVENKENTNFEEEKDASYEIAIKEAELLVEDYMKNLEKPNDVVPKTKDIIIKYKKLKVCSFFLGIVAIVRDSYCCFIEFILNLDIYFLIYIQIFLG